MEKRLGAVEKQLAAAKHTDIRLGDIVVSTDYTTNKICLHNLKTDKVVCLGDDDEDLKWSFSGVLEQEDSADPCSPPHVMARNDTVVEIVLAMVAVADGDVSVVVHLNDDTFTYSATLPSGTSVWITPVNIPVTRNTKVHVCMSDYGTEGENRDLSVFLRLGSTFTPHTDSTT